jgi:hypothetical protein
MIYYFVVVLCITVVLTWDNDLVVFFDHLVRRLLGLRGHLIPEISNSELAAALCSARRKVLYGVFSTAKKIGTRNVLRIHDKPCDLNGDQHRTIFVVGKPKTMDEYNVIQHESQLHKDIFVLSCDENMNYGKSYFFFKEAYDQLPCFDYYAKVDDDTAFVPVSIMRTLPDDASGKLLFLGRRSRNIDIMYWYMYVLKCIQWGFMDMSWIRNFKDYTAGMLYILNNNAVKSWMALGSVDLYGDEDYRTTYYMSKIGADFFNYSTMFHDYHKYRGDIVQGDWKRNITNESLAIHQCKSFFDLSSALNELCSVHADHDTNKKKNK